MKTVNPPSNLDLAALVARSLVAHPGEWARVSAPAMTVNSKALNMGVQETLVGVLYRIGVGDADGKGETRISFDTRSDKEACDLLEKALAPWRQEAAEEARATAIDRLNRQLGNEGPAREAAAKRLAG